jgi:hypothetical protein
MPLYVQNGNLLNKTGTLGISVGCCCYPPPPPPPPPCAEGSADCTQIIGNDYPECFEIIRSETVCSGAYFQEARSFGDCNPILSFKGRCSDPAFPNVPSAYDNCYCVSIESSCSNYAYNIQIDAETGACTCLKFIIVIRYRTADFVFNATTCQWIKVDERLRTDLTDCGGFGDCSCPDPPTCDPPAIGNSYAGCTDLCNPFP